MTTQLQPNEIECAECGKNKGKLSAKKVNNEYICKDCYNPFVHKENPRSSTFYKELRGVLTYPFLGTNKYTLIAGALFFAVIDILAHASIYGFLVGIAIFAYLSAYMCEIIVSSAQARKGLPEWPDIAGFSVVSAIVKVWGTLALCLVPTIIYLFQLDRFWDFSIPVVAALAGIGLLYFPMALASASMAYSFSSTLWAIGPQTVIPLIMKGPGRYLISLLFLGVLIGVSWAGEALLANVLPQIHRFLSRPISLYLLMASMRVIGIAYGANANIKADAN